MSRDSGRGPFGSPERVDPTVLMEAVAETLDRAREMRADAARARATSAEQREANRLLRLRARAWMPD